MEPAPSHRFDPSPSEKLWLKRHVWMKWYVWHLTGIYHVLQITVHADAAGDWTGSRTPRCRSCYLPPVAPSSQRLRRH